MVTELGFFDTDGTDGTDFTDFGRRKDQCNQCDQSDQCPPKYLRIQGVAFLEQRNRPS